jgi:hypothetical protein
LCIDTVEEARVQHDKNLIVLVDRGRAKGLQLNVDKLQANRKLTTSWDIVRFQKGLQPERKIQAFEDIQTLLTSLR